jgi:hypothetical protein
MITAILKQICSDSGCSLVIYEQVRLANLYADHSNQIDTVAIIMQPERMTLEVKANAIMEHYKPMIIEVIAQVQMEDSADNNEVQLQYLLAVCKEIITRIIAAGVFKTIKPAVLDKVLENRYDANVIGWRMSIDLLYLHNETKYPCVSPPLYSFT